MKLNMKYVIFGCVLLLVILITSTTCGAMPYSDTTRSYATFEGFTIAEINILKRDFDKKIRELLTALGGILSEVEKEYLRVADIKIENLLRRPSYSITDVETSLRDIMSKLSPTSDGYKKIDVFINDFIKPIKEKSEIMENRSVNNSIQDQAEKLNDALEKVSVVQQRINDEQDKKEREAAITKRQSHIITKQGFTTISASNTSIDKYSSAVGNQRCVKTASGLSNSTGALCLSEEQLYLLQSRGGNSSGKDSQIGM